VKNGMFFGQALQLCPNLKPIPYDFDAYRSVSQLLYDTVARSVDMLTFLFNSCSQFSSVCALRFRGHVICAGMHH